MTRIRMNKNIIVAIFLTACSSAVPQASKECPTGFVDEQGVRHEYPSCPSPMVRTLKVGRMPDGGKPIRFCICE